MKRRQFYLQNIVNTSSINSVYLTYMGTFIYACFGAIGPDFQGTFYWSRQARDHFELRFLQSLFQKSMLQTFNKMAQNHRQLKSVYNCLLEDFLFSPR